MNTFLTNNPVVFLLGAGFNYDAAFEAGQTSPLPSGRTSQYPLVSDLLDVCFELDALPPDKSVEDLFQDSIKNGNQKPLDVLYEVLMEADYYITPHLKPGGSHADNIYIKFLKDFSNAPLLTFNYDSLPEILLLAERAWSPFDGYGVQVQAHTKKIRKGLQPLEESLRSVLHLHGSLCVYPSTFYIEKRPAHEPDLLRFDRPPDFLFDPDAIGHCFFPFERIPPGVTYTHVSDRVIAPVPNKAEGLKAGFINSVYGHAKRFISRTGQIISIGYSFNRHDMLSYRPLLDAVSEKEVLLVAPDAKTLIPRLSDEYHDIKWAAQNMSFKEWVNNGYPGIYDKI
ncbi:MAG: hypothetical protein JRJ25_01825 [Deltaproteobacteria bacterium]|nr:hypothetical protein [Deltaproteobacteria bacterium]